MLGKQDKEILSLPWGVYTLAQADGLYYLKYDAKGVHGALHKGVPEEVYQSNPWVGAGFRKAFEKEEPELS